MIISPPLLHSVFIPIFWRKGPEIFLSESSPPASPGETVEPGEKHLGGEGGPGLGGEVVHLLLQVNVLGLRIAEEVEEEDRHNDGELEGEGDEGDREVVIEIMAAAYHGSEEN